MENYPTAIDVVAAALIDAAGQVLLARRPWNKHHGGLWEFPGGKVDAGENHNEALVRELHEELDIRAFAPDFQYIGSVDVGGDTPIRLHLYYVPSWQGTPLALEHLALRWCPCDAIVKQTGNDLLLPPGDRALAKMLENFHGGRAS